MAVKKCVPVSRYLKTTHKKTMETMYEKRFLDLLVGWLEKMILPNGGFFMVKFTMGLNPEKITNKNKQKDSYPRVN